MARKISLNVSGPVDDNLAAVMAALDCNQTDAVTRSLGLMAELLRRYPDKQIRLRDADGNDVTLVIL